MRGYFDDATSYTAVTSTLPLVTLENPTVFTITKANASPKFYSASKMSFSTFMFDFSVSTSFEAGDDYSFRIDFGTPFGANYFCQIFDDQGEFVWGVSSCIIVEGSNFVDIMFDETVTANTVYTVKLLGVVLPASTTNMVIKGSVMYSGLTYFDDKDGVAWPTLTDGITGGTVALLKNYNSYFSDATWKFNIQISMDFTSKGVIQFMFPTYYSSKLGEVQCAIEEVEVSCEVNGDWMLRINGPAQTITAQKLFIV